MASSHLKAAAENELSSLTWLLIILIVSKGANVFVLGNQDL